MNTKNQEYELFKSICQSQLIEVSQNDIHLIAKLQKKGLNIIRSEQSYFLDDQIHILNEDEIRLDLNSQINDQIECLDVIFETTSTNKAISHRVPDKYFTVLVAEYQSHGQGRREKKWISPIGSNIYLSIQFHLTEDKNTQFIPLISAVSVCKALSRIGVHGCKIKWPNDIYLDDKKVGGILTESRYNPHNHPIFIVGIGLNVNMQSNSKIDQLWTSIRNSCNKVVNRNTILSALLAEILPEYLHLSQLDIQQFKNNWYSMDLLQGRTIQISDEEGSYEAVALGIADDGALIIEHDPYKTKVKRKIYSAEVSVKRQAKVACKTEISKKD